MQSITGCQLWIIDLLTEPMERCPSADKLVQERDDWTILWMTNGLVESDRWDTPKPSLKSPQMCQTIDPRVDGQNHRNRQQSLKHHCHPFDNTELVKTSSPQRMTNFPRPLSPGRSSGITDQQCWDWTWSAHGSTPTDLSITVEHNSGGSNGSQNETISGNNKNTQSRESAHQRALHATKNRAQKQAILKNGIRELDWSILEIVTQQIIDTLTFELNLILNQAILFFCQ